MSAPLESYSRPGSGLERFEVQGMGTRNVLLLGGAPADEIRKGAQAAFDTLLRLEQSLSKFLPSSDLSILNAVGARQPVAVGDDLRRLLERSMEAWELTDGAFDPTVGPLLEAWGLVRMEGRIPSESELERLRARRGMSHVVLEGESGKVRLDVPGVSLDLGGIAKGYAVDAVASDLRARGIPTGAVVSGRSSLALWGSPPGEERWRVEVVHPGDDREDLCELLVEPGAVSTSGSSERKFLRGGREFGHLLDPRSGAPARGVKAVTVWTPNALLGDVLSTTLFVLGRRALEEGGAVERLVGRWGGPSGPGRPAEGPGRASVLLIEENPRVWGGIEVVERHLGEPGFIVAGR